MTQLIQTILQPLDLKLLSTNSLDYISIKNATKPLRPKRMHEIWKVNKSPNPPLQQKGENPTQLLWYAVHPVALPKILMYGLHEGDLDYCFIGNALKPPALTFCTSVYPLLKVLDNYNPLQKRYLEDAEEKVYEQFRALQSSVCYGLLVEVDMQPTNMGEFEKNVFLDVPAVLHYLAESNNKADKKSDGESRHFLDYKVARNTSDEALLPHPQITKPDSKTVLEGLHPVFNDTQIGRIRYIVQFANNREIVITNV